MALGLSQLLLCTWTFHHALSWPVEIDSNPQKSSGCTQLCVCKTTHITTCPQPSPFPGFLLYSGASSAPKLTSQGYFEPLLLSYSSSNSGHVMPCPLPKCLWCLLSPLNFLPALAQSPIIPNLHPILPPSSSKQKFVISSLCKAIWHPLTCKIESKLLSAMHKAL